MGAYKSCIWQLTSCTLHWNGKRDSGPSVRVNRSWNSSGRRGNRVFMVRSSPWGWFRGGLRRGRVLLDTPPGRVSWGRSWGWSFIVIVTIHWYSCAVCCGGFVVAMETPRGWFTSAKSRELKSLLRHVPGARLRGEGREGRRVFFFRRRWLLFHKLIDKLYVGSPWEFALVRSFFIGALHPLVRGWPRAIRKLPHQQHLSRIHRKFSITAGFKGEQCFISSIPRHLR